MRIDLARVIQERISLVDCIASSDDRQYVASLLMSSEKHSAEYILNHLSKTQNTLLRNYCVDYSWTISYGSNSMCFIVPSMSGKYVFEMRNGILNPFRGNKLIGNFRYLAERIEFSKKYEYRLNIVYNDYVICVIKGEDIKDAMNNHKQLQFKSLDEAVSFDEFNLEQLSDMIKILAVVNFNMMEKKDSRP